MWERTFDDQKSSINNRVFGTATGRTYWAGTTSRTKAEIIGVIPGNLTEYSQDFPKTSGTISNKAFEFNSSEFLFLGDVASGDNIDMRLLRSSTAGTELQNLVIDETYNVAAKSISSTNNGTVILGQADNENGDFYMAIVAPDADATSVEGKLFGGANADIPAKVLVTNDGILMYGHTNFSRANTLVLMKTDLNGEF